MNRLRSVKPGISKVRKPTVNRVPKKSFTSQLVDWGEQCGYKMSENVETRTLSIDGLKNFSPIDFLILMWLDSLHDYKDNTLFKSMFPPSRQRGSNTRKYGSGMTPYLKRLGMSDSEINNLFGKAFNQRGESVFVQFPYKSNVALQNTQDNQFIRFENNNIYLNWTINSSNLETKLFDYMTLLVLNRFAGNDTNGEYVFGSYDLKTTNTTNLPLSKRIKIALDADRKAISILSGKPGVLPIVNLGNLYDAGQTFAPLVSNVTKVCLFKTGGGNVKFEPNNLKFSVSGLMNGNIEATPTGCLITFNLKIYGIDIVNKKFKISSRGTPNNVDSILGKFFGDFSQILYNLKNTDQFFGSFDQTTISSYIWCCLAFKKPVRYMTEKAGNNVILYYPSGTSKASVSRLRTLGVFTNKFKAGKNIRRVQRCNDANNVCKLMARTNYKNTKKKLNVNNTLTFFAMQNTNPSQYLNLNKNTRKQMKELIVKALVNNTRGKKTKQKIRNRVKETLPQSNFNNITSQVNRNQKPKDLEKMLRKLSTFLKNTPSYKTQVRSMLNNMNTN